MGCSAAFGAGGVGLGVVDEQATTGGRAGLLERVSGEQLGGADTPGKFGSPQGTARYTAFACSPGRPSSAGGDDPWAFWPPLDPWRDFTLRSTW